MAEKLLMFNRYDKKDIQYLSKVSEYKRNYGKIKDYLKKSEYEQLRKFDLQTLKKLMYAENNIQKDIICNLINMYDFIKEIPVCIFLSGSLARHTNRFNSDVDITFLYPNKYKNIMMCVEEEIAIFLSHIFGFRGRDRVHSMCIYLDKSDEIIKYDKCVKYTNSNIYLNYVCRDNTENLMDEIFNTSREYDDFLKHIRKHSGVSGCVEWAYSMDVLYENKYNIKNDILNMDKEIFSRGDFETETLNLIDDMYDRINQINNLDIEEGVRICDLKVIYKKQILSTLYDILSMIRRVGNYKGKKIEFINLRKYCKSKDIYDILYMVNDDFFDVIYKYLWQLMRIEYILDELGKDFSSHCEEKININEFKEIAKIKLNSKDIFKELNDDFNLLKNRMISVINTLKQNINNYENIKIVE